MVTTFCCYSSRVTSSGTTWQRSSRFTLTKLIEIHLAFPIKTANSCVHVTKTKRELIRQSDYGNHFNRSINRFNIFVLVFFFIGRGYLRTAESERIQ